MKGSPRPAAQKQGKQNLMLLSPAHKYARQIVWLPVTARQHATRIYIRKAGLQRNTR